MIEKAIKYNVAQLGLLFCFIKTIVCEFGRGAGKTFILAKRMIDCVHEMPRSNGVLVGETYVQIENKVMNSMKESLEQHGYYEDIHYVIGRKPPISWPRAYGGINDYKHVMSWYNGTVVEFLSQDGSATSGRGGNIDWVLADEAARLDEKKFKTDVIYTNRGNLNRLAIYPDGTKRLFSACPLHHSSLIVTSTPVEAKGQWIIRYEELARLNPKKVKFLRASAKVNRENLGEDYFQRERDGIPDWLYDAEVNNIRISTVDGSFYPKLREDVHCYNQYDQAYYDRLKASVLPSSRYDKDVDPNRPLDVAVDFGSRINSMVVCQENGRELRALKNLFVKSPRMIDDLVTEEFVPYYRAHINKVMHLWYDPSGNVSVANSRRTYAQQLISKLQQHGWDVRVHTSPTAYNERHSHKYNLWKTILSEESESLPLFRINKTNARELFISMSNAPAIEHSSKDIRKDKKSERSKTIDQAHATHLSDTIDLIIVGKYLARQLGFGASAPATTTT